MKHTGAVREKVKVGEESEVQGLLEQWLREDKMTEAEALMTSADMFGAGVDTVSINQPDIAILKESVHACYIG